MFKVQAFYNELDGFFAKKNSEGLEEFLINSWEQARQTEDTAYLIAVANELGGWYRTKGNIEEAKELYSLALDAVEKVNGKNHENYATTLINTGDVYLMEKDYDAADAYFNEALEILLNLGLEEDYRAAALWNNMSVVRREKGQYDEAVEALNKALALIEKIGQAPEEMATSLINLGQLRIKQKKYDQAEENLKQAISMYEKELGTSYPHYAIALAGLAECYYFQGEYDLAEFNYVHALEDMEKRYGPSAHVVKSLSANLEQVRRSKES